MKTLLTLGLFLILESCATTTVTKVVKYNHITHETYVNDSLQPTTHVYMQYEDELQILSKEPIQDIKPIGFDFEYNVEVNDKHLGYFYAPSMSEYMQNNDVFVFEITYKL